MEKSKVREALRECIGMFAADFCDRCPYTTDPPTCIRRLHLDVLEYFKHNPLHIRMLTADEFDEEGLQNE